VNIINDSHSDAIVHIDGDIETALTPAAKQHPFNGGAIIDEQGREVLITEAMVNQALIELHQENISYSSSYCLAACTSLS